MTPEIERARRLADAFENSIQEALRASHVSSRDVLWPIVSAIGQVPGLTLEIHEAAARTLGVRRSILQLVLTMLALVAAGAAGYAWRGVAPSAELERARHSLEPTSELVGAIRNDVPAMPVLPGSLEALPAPLRAELARVADVAIRPDQRPQSGFAAERVPFPCLAAGPRGFAFRQADGQEYVTCVVLLPAGTAVSGDTLRAWFERNTANPAAATWGAAQPDALNARGGAQ